MKLSIVATFTAVLAAMATSATPVESGRKSDLIPFPDELFTDHPGIAALDSAFGFSGTVQPEDGEAEAEGDGEEDGHLVARAFNLKGCVAACKSVKKMEKFCRIIPHPAIRAGCWGTSVAISTPFGQTLCKNWCHGIF